MWFFEFVKWIKFCYILNDYLLLTKHVSININSLLIIKLYLDSNLLAHKTRVNDFYESIILLICLFKYKGIWIKLNKHLNFINH